MMRFTIPHPRRAFHQPPGRENARSHQEFATIRAILAQRTDKAVLLARDDLLAPVWVPRQALGITGKLAVEKAVLKTEIEIDVELGLALQKGLV